MTSRSYARLSVAVCALVLAASPAFAHSHPVKMAPDKDATVGALRAKATHVNTELMSAGGLKPVKSGSVLSTADVYKMFQQGDARLGEPIGYL